MSGNSGEKKQQSTRQRDQPLKLLPLCILRILEKNTDGDNLMSAEAIRKCVMTDYGLEVERKAVANNLMMLLKFDHRINSKTTERNVGQEINQKVSTGWFCEPALEPEELRYLADAICSFSRMPQRQKIDLWKKVSSFGGAHAKELKGIGDIYCSDPQRIVNKQLFHTISVLDEALGKRSRICFYLGSHDLTGKLSISPDEKPMKIDPCFMAVSNGRYYLLGSFPENSKLYHFRIDLMLDAELCHDANDEPITAKIPSDKYPDIQAYLESHLYMYSDPITSVSFKVKNTDSARHQVFDQFGTSVRLKPKKGKHKDDEYLIATVKANEQAMLYWAMQYSGMVEVLTPPSLREALYREAQRTAEMYKVKLEEA